MPARLLVWLRTNGLMKIGHLYCYLIKYCIDDLLSLRMDPRNWRAYRYIHDRKPVAENPKISDLSNSLWWWHDASQ
jgi:hypothetical protein